MCNPSPAKVIRNVKRITKFLERKYSMKPILSMLKEPTLSPQIRPIASLSIDVLPVVNIPKPLKTFVVCKLQQISITACPRPSNLSYQKFPTKEVVPGIRNYDGFLFSSYINGGSSCTTFVCSFCYVDYSHKSADAIRFTYKLSIDKK
jgi:hypothetical protein